MYVCRFSFPSLLVGMYAIIWDCFNWPLVLVSECASTTYTESETTNLICAVLRVGDTQLLASEFTRATKFLTNQVTLNGTGKFPSRYTIPGKYVIELFTFTSVYYGHKLASVYLFYILYLISCTLSNVQ